ncbi:endonuclease domain-containing protein [Brevundimonas naejangsanensis]|uniref:Endonuclease domain-containing protein n=1 Tax=Brevundimonas naejangsanensis TaxID=588932 RepID=A0A494RHS0_9CAUL|nr:endonuclease domain-containing protein [Brevundimonas naejangsanensis]AYG94979.1 endonuclease domain-containing protein [Brevundimonas naejangsanensis]
MSPTIEAYRRAARMRRSLTPPEARLWSCLKGGALEGLKFRRQHPAGSYILDFYCVGARLAVEVDGAAHDDPAQIAHDERRTAWLKAQGIEVLRVRATDIRDHLEGVLAVILHDATGR